MPFSRRVAAACLALGLTASAAVPAYAESRAHRLHREQRHAAVLDVKAHRQAAQLASMRQRLVVLNAAANAALEKLQQARLVADKAQADSDAAKAALAKAQAETDKARATLSEMAAGAYRTIAGGGALGTTLSLVETGNPQTFLDGINVIGEVGKSQAAVIDELRVAEAAQGRAEMAAAAAAARAAAAEHVAEVAKAAADSVVARQQTLVEQEQSLLARTRSAAAGAHADVRRLAHEIAVARARAAAIRRAQAAAAARNAASGGPIPTCHGGTVSGYSNGQLPMSALCPLWDAPGMMLQAGASAGFNRMSQAFASAFGEPLCVTSSYRTYAKQVELYASMPAGYAAVPGTSNHGWGLAVDLCGGIQVDYSPEHEWLMNHAAEYSWFHPSWALPGGPGPHEPWHWEFAG
jgi:D-alanyl-D-alanine carboxypeptidase-like protein